MSLKTYYLRVYALLLVLTLGAGMLGYSLLAALNGVREQAWQEQFPRPLVSWLIKNPAAAKLATWGNDDVRLDFRSEDQLALTRVARERLGYGQVLARHEGDGVHLLALTPERLVAELVVSNLYRNITELSALLATWQLEQTDEADRDNLMLAVGAELGLSLRYLDRRAQLPGQSVLDRVADDGFAFDQKRPGDPARVLVRMDSGRILQIVPRPPFDPWSWPSLLLILALISGVLAVALFFWFNNFYQRLRGIENVVGRIARGELDARVRVGKQSIVDRLGAAFNSMAEHIQRLVNVQREMIHAVSHELRTPVARIRFGVQMIEDCPDEDSLRKQLRGIDTDIQELDELIDEILTYARLEQGGPILAFQTENVAAIVEQVVREQQTTRPELRIHADIDPGPEQWHRVDIEPRYIHRAIQNLVGNATRYAKAEVRVHCHFGEETCRVDVEDDGPGIPEADWEKVFTPFARLDDSRTRKSGGYGLGLSIVRRILYWHGGQAFLGRSAELGGARFSLVWPRRQHQDA